MARGVAKSRLLLSYVPLVAGFLGVILLFATPVHGATGINQQLNFQGRLLNSQGATVPDGYYNLEFKIYQDGDGQSAADATGSPSGTLKWTEDHLNANSQGVQVKNGFLSVQLGSITAFGSNINWNQDTLWLSMNVGGTGSCSPFSACVPDGEMLPMKRISSAPYALNSAQLGGLDASQFLQLGQGAQTDTSNNSSLYVNKTGSGDLIQLQSGSADAFIVTNSGDLTFGANANHTISVATAGSGVAGKSLTLSAGGAGSGASALTGGNLVLQGGTGGGTNGNGGSVSIDAGAKNGSGSDGAINIGTTTASAITIGKSGITTHSGGNLTVDSGDFSVTSGVYKVASTTVIDASRNLTNIGTISSGLINNQTISSTANFTGTLNVAGDFTVATNKFKVDSATGNVVNVGNITGSGALTLASGGSNGLTLSSGSGTIGLGSGTVQRVAAGLTIDVQNTATSTLSILNSDVSNVANLDVEGGLNIGSGQTYKINNSQIDSSALSNNASLVKTSGNFTIGGNFTYNGTGYYNLNATTALKVENSSGNTNVFVVDTTNSRVGLGAAPTASTQLFVKNTGGNTNLLDLQNSSGVSRLLVADSGAITASASVSSTSGTFIARSSSTSRTEIGNVGPAGQAGILFNSLQDTNLYRSNAGELTTDGALKVTGSFTVNTNKFQVDSATGDISKVGNITGSGALTLSSGGSSGLTLTSASGTIGLGSNTLQRAASGLTIDVLNAGASTLSILNSDATNVANLSVEGGLSIGSGQTYKINGTQIDSTALSNDANLVKTSGNFTIGGNFTYNGTGYYNLNATTALKVEQSGTHNNTLVVDTTNGTVGIGQAPSSSVALSVNGEISSGTVITAQTNFRITNTTAGYFQKKYNGATGITAGDVLVYDTSANNQVKRATTARDPKIAGVAVNTLSGGTVYVAVAGSIDVNVDTAQVNRGDQIVSTTAAGVGTVDNTAVNGIVGIALTSKAAGSAGTVTVALRISDSPDTPVFRNSGDSTTAFQIQNANGNSNLFVADTTDTKIGIAQAPAAAGAALQVTGGITATTGNLNATAGTLQTNGTDRIDNSGDLVNIGTIAASGAATLQGTITLSALSAGGFVKAASGTGQLSVAVAGVDYEVPLTFNNGLSRSGNTVSGIDAVADSSTKGVATFNATNFSSSGGIINTIQGIATTSTPTFAGLGIGQASNYKLDILSTGGSDIHFGPSDSGGYLSSFNSAGGASLSGGAAYNGTNWVAKGANAAILQEASGGITFFGDTGLTAGTTYTPTARLNVTNLGLTTITLNSGSSEVGKAKFGTPGGFPGLQFVNASGTGLSEIRQSATGGGLGFGVTTGSTTPADQITLDTNGAVLFKNSTNTSAALQVQPSGSTTPVFKVDTTGNGAVTIGSGASSANVLNGTINGQTISSSAVFTGTVAVQGATVTIGHSGSTDVQGAVKFDTTAGRMAILQTNTPTGSGDATFNLPAIAGGSSDTICVQTNNNCSFAVRSSGTQNFIPKWNNVGGTSLGNSQLFDNGTGVSVGSSSVTGLFNVGASNQFQVSSTGAVTAVGVDSGTGVLQGTGGATVAGTIKFTSLNTAGILHTDNTGQLSTGAVVLGTDTSGNYVASLGALTGLTTSGNSGAGSTPTLSVSYGSGANTAAQGNTALSFTGSGNLTGSISGTAGGGFTTTSLTVVNNPTFSGLITAQASDQAILLSGTPTAGTGTHGLLQLGGNLTGGNAATNGGTYLSISEPGSLAGSAADFLNFQWNGSDRLKVTSAGALTTASTLTVSSGGLAVTGNSTIAGTLSSLTGLTSSGTIQFSGLNSTGIVHNSNLGVLSTGAVALGSETSGNYIQQLGALTGLTTTTSPGAGAQYTLSVQWGSTSTTSVRGDTSLVCPSGTGNLSGTGNTITLGSGGTCNSLTVVNNPTFSGLVTGNGGLTTGGSTTLTNGGATVNTVDALGSLGSGSIGSAASTVDIYTAFTVNMIASGNTLTIPSPTNTAAGRIIYISNIGTQGFTLLGTTVNAGTSATLMWNGSAWTFSGADGNGILNQNSSDQTANFRISGSGQANTSFLSPQFDVASAGILSLGTGTLATGISIGRSAITTTVQGTFQVGSSGVTATTAGAVTAAGAITGQAGTTGLALTGTPVAGSGATSLLQLGSTIASGNTATNGGTYFGINEPGSGAGSAADFLNFQVNGTWKAKLTNTGSLSLAGGSSSIGLQNASGGSTLSFSSSDGILKVWDSSTASPSNYAMVSYSSNTAVFAASSGTTQLGLASGNVTIPLTGATDRFLFTKTYTPTAAYSTNEFTIQRILTGGTNSLSGNVLGVEDRSTGSVNSDTVLYLNQNNASSTGYILQAQTGASINQLTLDNSGNLNVHTSYEINGVSGISTICSAGQALVGGTVSGGITTAGSCSSGTGTLQTDYDNSTSPATINTTSGKGILFKPVNSGAENTNLFRIQNSSSVDLFNVDSSDKIIQIGSASSDGNEVTLALDQYNAFTDSGTCGTTADPNGAMYFNTVSNSVRACLGGSWEDLVSSTSLGILLFGVMPDSGSSNQGDTAALASVGVSGPCKVSWASATTVSVNACTAYSGGRKVVVSSSTITLPAMATSAFIHICLTGSGNQPAASASGTETANLPTFSTTAPILCLADVKNSASSANTIGQIYDTRTFTNTQKDFVTVSTTAAGLGQVVVANGVNATQSSGVATTVMGVVVATNGGTSTTTPAAIIATAGPTWVKASAGTAGQFVQSGTSGLATTTATAAFGTMGINRTAWTGTCSAAATCLDSLYTNLVIK